MTKLTHNIRLRTDFNDATEDEATALIEGLYVELRAGELVELYAADRNTSQGIVERIADGLVYVRPDWDSWHEEPRVEVVGQPHEALYTALYNQVRAFELDRTTASGAK